MTKVTDEFDLGRCLEMVRQRNQDAASALVEAVYPLVIRIVRNHLPVRLSEEDLAQDVFAKIFSCLDRYEPRTGVPFEHWVSRLAVRTCLDALRAESRRPELRWGDLSEEQCAWLEFMIEDESRLPDASPASARELLNHLLSQLPPKDRLVIMLLDLEQQSVKQVSQLTGWSITLVKVRNFRARHRLRKVADAFKTRYPNEIL